MHICMNVFGFCRKKRNSTSRKSILIGLKRFHSCLNGIQTPLDFKNLSPNSAKFSEIDYEHGHNYEFCQIGKFFATFVNLIWGQWR